MKEANPNIYGSMKAAGAALCIPGQVMRWAKARGCPAFTGNRVHGDVLQAWLEKNQPDEDELIEDSSLRDQKTREEVRKLKLANDLKEGKLLTRAWVIERMNRAAGEIHAHRAKSEAEHPLLFSAAAGDVAGCRTILRGIWSEIFTKIAGLGEHFTEGIDEALAAAEESQRGPKDEVQKAVKKYNKKLKGGE